MQINSKERILVFTDEDLTNPRTMRHVYHQVLSVMLYPDDADKQKLYLLGLYAAILNSQYGEQERKNYLLNNPSLLYALYEDEKNKKAQIVFRYAHMSRKKKHGTGAPITRGMIAGRLLDHLEKPHIHSLEESYKEYLLKPISYEGEPIKPSKSLLRKIWEEFRSISHLWAAIAVYREASGVDISILRPENPYDPVVDPEAALHFTNFLQFGSYFRKQLVKAKNLTTYYAPLNEEDTTSVWKLINNGEPIPTAELSFKKNQ